MDPWLRFQTTLRFGSQAVRRGSVARRDECVGSLYPDSVGSELDGDAGAGVGGLGDGVLPGALAGASHHQQVAVAHRERDRGAAASGAEQQSPRVAERDDRDHGVLGLPAPDGVAVPRDAVATVAVVAAASGDERLAQLGSVVVRERLAGRIQTGVRERFARAVRVHEAGYVDHPVVHLAALGSPRHVGQTARRRPRRRRRSSWVGRRPTHPATAEYDGRPRAATPPTQSVRCRTDSPESRRSQSKGSKCIETVFERVGDFSG